MIERPIFKPDQVDQIQDERVNRYLDFIYSRQNLGLQVVTKTATATLTNRDAVVLIDATSAAITITLAPANSWKSGKSPIIILRRIDNSANAVNYQPGGSDTVDGAAGAIAIAGLGRVRLITNSSTGYYTV